MIVLPAWLRNIFKFTEFDPVFTLTANIQPGIELSLRGEPLGAEAEGGIIGEMAMINAATRSVTATTLSKVRLARVDRDRFRELVNNNGEFSLHVMAVLANRLRALDNFITLHLAKR